MIPSEQSTMVKIILAVSVSLVILGLGMTIVGHLLTKLANKMKK